MRIILKEYFNVTLPWPPIRQNPNGTDFSERDTTLVFNSSKPEIIVYVLGPLLLFALIIYVLIACRKISTTQSH